MKFKALSNDKRSIQNTLNWTAINAYTARYKPDTWFDIAIVRKVAKSSDPQRKYYFSTVVRTYAKEAGYDETEYYLFHCFLKFRYFEGYYKGRGENDKVPYLDDHHIMRNVPALFADDSEFNTKDKANFINWVVRRAAHENVYIPDANE